MKAVSIKEAEGQLGKLIAEALSGETIVLSDGDNKVTLTPGTALDWEESAELEAELLKAADGPFKPYREDELREIADRALVEHRAKRKK
jgi:hypothetical protein